MTSEGGQRQVSVYDWEENTSLYESGSQQNLTDSPGLKTQGNNYESIIIEGSTTRYTHESNPTYDDVIAPVHDNEANSCEEDTTSATANPAE